MSSKRACVRCAVAAAATLIAFTASAVAVTPAFAAEPAVTKITGFTVAPSNISYGSQDVTISGTLIDEATSTGISGETIDISDGGPTFTTLTTGSAGIFSGTVDLPAAGEVTAVYEAGNTSGRQRRPGPGPASRAGARWALNSAL